MGDVEVGIAVGFADDDQAGGCGGADVFGGDFDEEAAGTDQYLRMPRAWGGLSFRP